MKIGSILHTHSRFRPDHLAVVFGSMRLTFREVNARVNKLANALASHGIQPGDKIACVTPNCLEMLELYWATAKLGAVAVPLSPLLNGRGLKTLLDHCD